MHVPAAPSATQTSRLTTIILLCLFITGCPFGPPLPIEENLNYPPFILEDDVDPQEYQIVLRRSEGSRTFELKRCLDSNDNETLQIYWFAPTIAGGFQLRSGPSQRENSIQDRVEEIFYVYEGDSYDLDPCNESWQNREELPISVLVSDGPLSFQDGQFITTEGRFFDSYTWVIRFEGECL